MSDMVALAVLLLPQDPQPEKIKPETVLGCLRCAVRETESFRPREARKSRGSETQIDYRKGEAVILQTIGHSHRMGLSLKRWS